MADNVNVTAGTGTTIAADEVVDDDLGTVKVQYVKIMDGTLDGTSKAAVGANGIKVDGSGVTQPVDIGSSGQVSVSGTVSVVGTDNATSGTITDINDAIAVTGLVGSGSATIQTTGTYTGALTPQMRTNGSDWVTIGGTPLINMNTGAASATIPSGATSIYQISLPSAEGFRVIALGAVTGTANVTLHASAGAGQLVNIQDGGGSITVDGSVTANAGTNLNTSALALEAGGNLAGAATSLAVIDDWDESDRAKVNLIVGQAGVQGGSGAVSATTQRVVLATDVALPAGTNAIGKLSANDGVDIGDVTINNTSIAVTQATASNLNVTEASAASSLTSLQLIDDIVYTDDTSTHSTGSSKGALFMAAATPTDGSVNANDIGAVAMTTDRKLHVSVQDALPAGTNAIGKLSANSGVDIGDVDVTSLPVAFNTGTRSATTQRVTIATDDLVPANITQLAGNSISTGVGATGTGVQRIVEANNAGRTLSSAGGSASSSGNNTLVSAGTNKLKVYAFSLSTTSTTAVTCIFQSGASGTELWRVVLQAPSSVSTGANLVVNPPSYIFATASATLLNLNLSGAQTVHWSVSYFDEA